MSEGRSKGVFSPARPRACADQSIASKFMTNTFTSNWRSRHLQSGEIMLGIISSLIVTALPIADYMPVAPNFCTTSFRYYSVAGVLAAVMDQQWLANMKVLSSYGVGYRKKFPFSVIFYLHCSLVRLLSVSSTITAMRCSRCDLRTNGLMIWIASVGSGDGQLTGFGTKNCVYSPKKEVFVEVPRLTFMLYAYVSGCT